MDKETICIYTFIISFLIVAVYILNNGMRETFLPYSIYPKTFTTMLLEDTFVFKNPIKINEFHKRRILHPTWSIGSYKQETNNRRDLETPCNGRELRYDMCEELYKKKKTPEYCQVSPPNKNCRRINYYCKK